MGVPANDPNHVAEGLGYLTSRYTSQAAVTGIVKSLMSRFQLYETAFQNFLFDIVLSNHPLAGGPWDILDKIGSIFKVPRLGRADVDYLAAIKLRMRVLRSHGLAEDIIQIAALIIHFITVGGIPNQPGFLYTDYPPAAFEVYDIPPSTTNERDALLQNLGEAKSAGTYGLLRYATTAPAINITWSSAISGGGIGFSSSRTGTPPNVMVSLMQLTRVPGLGP